MSIHDFFLIPYVQRLFIAAMLGFAIGVERELRGKPASLRTFSMICVGSCLFSILSIEAAGHSLNGAPYDVTRIAAQIVTGIGFLGGGVIFKTTDRVEGITTGALIWLTAAIGMAVGFGQIALAICAVMVGAFIHVLSFVFYKVLDFDRHKREEVETGD